MITKSLNFMLFFYVFGVFIFSKVEGLSLATNIALLLLLLILVIKGFKNRLVGIENCLIIVPLAMLLFASILWSEYQVEATIQFLSFLTASLGGMAVMLALMNGANPKVVFWAAFLGSGYLVYSAWQEKTLFALSRAAGIAGNANELGVTLIIAGLIMSLHEFSGRFRYWPKFYALFLLVFSIYVTGSRTMLFVLLLSPFVYLNYIFKKTEQHSSVRQVFVRIIVLALLIILLGHPIWQSFSNTETWKRTLEAFQGVNRSTETRKVMIFEGISLWSERPLLGYGINQFRFASGWRTYSHSNYTEMLVSGGLMGLLAFYGIYMYLLYKYKKTIGNKEPLIFWGLLLMFLWDVSVVSYYAKYIWLFIGIISWLVTGTNYQISMRKPVLINRGLASNANPILR